VITSVGCYNRRLPVDQSGFVNVLFHSRDDRTDERFIATYNFHILNFAVGSDGDG
jgi:hypothetical protein